MYLLFGGTFYEADGGFYDFIGVADSLQKLKDHAKMLCDKEYDFEWYHIVDSDTWQIVYSNDDDDNQ